MAELSALKKVQLLEEKVLSKDTAAVREFMAEQGPIEFTAKAIGLACRSVGYEMVETLLDGGATLSFDPTPALKRKYACRIPISNYNDVKIDYSLYLFREFRLAGYYDATLSDPERQEVIKVLNTRNACDLQEILYYAVLYGDDAILEALDRLGVNRLSAYRTEIVAGLISINQMGAVGRYHKGEFWQILYGKDDKNLLITLQRFLSRMEVDKITMFPSDFYESDYNSRPIKLISRYCSDTLFEFFLQKTNMVDKVKKWDMVIALLEENNAPGMQYALSEGWIKKQTDIEFLISEAQKKKDISTEIMTILLEKQNTMNGDQPNKLTEELLSLDETPMTAAEWKKIWGLKKQDDGTLILTSYKGDSTDVVIPSVIGKNTVTAIDSDAFNTEAPRLTARQKKVREEIVSVEFPGTIKVIPSNLFSQVFVNYGYSSLHTALKHIILNEGIEKISEYAFKDCVGIEEIIIPESVNEIGKGAFENCQALKNIHLPKALAVLRYGLFSGTGLETFEVGNNISNIEGRLFDNCRRLSSVKLPDTLTAIPGGMFSQCSSLKTVKIPENVTEIHEQAFWGCPFTEITLPPKLTTIGWMAFANCKFLKNIQIPDAVSLKRGVFSGCDQLANENGQIVVNGLYFGRINPKSGLWTDADAVMEPLELDKDIKEIASINEPPEIVFKTHCETGTNIDISQLSVGDEVFFGRFPEAEDYWMRPLKWRVLSIENGKALMITVNSIMGQSNELIQRGIWKDAPVRKLLNNGFYRTAFTDSEKEQILLSVISNPKNKAKHVDGGPDTEDRVFLLSLDEVEKYMQTEESRKASVTEYARNTYSAHRSCRWWQLRTPGKGGWGSVAISEDGDYIAMTGNHVGYSDLRPAIWIKNK